MPIRIDGSLGISNNDGDAIAPGLKGANNHVGIFFPSANTMAFSSSSTERMRVDANGNVGIGITPSYPLHVSGNATSTFSITVGNINAGSSAYSFFRMINNVDSDAGILRNSSTNPSYGGNNSINIYQLGAYPIGFVTNNTKRMIIDSSGRITTPYQPAFRAAVATSTSYGAGWSKITMGTVFTNIGNHFSSSRFTAPVAGMYQFNGSVSFTGAETDGTVALAVNGFVTNYMTVSIPNTGQFTGAAVSHCVYLSAGDYVELHKYNDTSRTTRGADWSGGFSGFLIG